ncbi:RNA-binding protein [Candidatus Peregrinibacteria bacterium CG_4_9_14_0_2_um_filter_53_11]|nr:MAG: RNA-binding protein [Candidatus Peregrinibacteria bacterium CG_4_9_14_0_2_um_filter_53_11]
MDTDITQGPDKDFVEYIVKQIVTRPEEVEVSRSVDEMGVLLTLKVAKEDMGRIIGKSGQTAKAIRILIRIIGSKNNARVNLKIMEPDGQEVSFGGDDFGDFGSEESGSGSDML